MLIFSVGYNTARFYTSVAYVFDHDIIYRSSPVVIHVLYAPRTTKRQHYSTSSYSREVGRGVETTSTLKIKSVNSKHIFIYPLLCSSWSAPASHSSFRSKDGKRHRKEIFERVLIILFRVPRLYIYTLFSSSNSDYELQAFATALKPFTFKLSYFFFLFTRFLIS